MSHYAEAEARILVGMCEALQLPSDEQGRARLDAAIDALFEAPAHVFGAQLQLRARMAEKFLLDAVERARALVDSDEGPFALYAFHAAVILVAAEQGLVTLPYRSLTTGVDTGMTRRVSFGDREGPAILDVAIWWRDDAEPEQPHGRTAVLVHQNADAERMRTAVAGVLRDQGWDVRVVPYRELEADPVGVARAVLTPEPVLRAPGLAVIRPEDKT